MLSSKTVACCIVLLTAACSSDVPATVPTSSPGDLKQEITAALKPVPWGSVPSLAAELKRCKDNPEKIVGEKVNLYVKAGNKERLLIKGSFGPRPKLSHADRARIYVLRTSMASQFASIYNAARKQQQHEYQDALNYGPSISSGEMAGGAAMEQVHESEIRREQTECSKIVIPARQAYASYSSKIGSLISGEENTVREVSSPGMEPKLGGEYGVIISVQTRQSRIVIPPFSYDASCGDVRTHHIDIGSLRTYYRVTLLYCGPHPNYIYPNAYKDKKKVIKGYLFEMKNGTKVSGSKYTVGDFYYHLEWHHISLLVAKDLVVKIKPVY